MQRVCTLVIILLLVISCSSCGYNNNFKLNNNTSGLNNNQQDTKSTVASLTESENNDKKSFKNIQENDFTIIPEQSFWVDLDDWGKAKFVSGYYKESGLPKLSFYLVDSNNSILYSFPEFYGNMWVFYEINAISFRDANKDGLKDIIISADYILGHGENAATSFSVAGIYFQKGKEFINLPGLDKEINESKKNENIDMILKFVENKDINLYN